MRQAERVRERRTAHRPSASHMRKKCAEGNGSVMGGVTGIVVGGHPREGEDVGRAVRRTVVSQRMPNTELRRAYEQTQG